MKGAVNYIMPTVCHLHGGTRTNNIIARVHKLVYRDNPLEPSGNSNVIPTRVDNKASFNRLSYIKS